MLLSDEQLDRELLRMTDSFTEELFQVDTSLATPVVFPVSRLVVDPERFVDDADEPMARRGMGAVYTRTSHGALLRKEETTPERDRLIAEFYQPHHRHLTDAVQATLDHRSSCLIIDCHSFASVPLPHEPDQAHDRPDICLGTDECHSPKQLVAQACGMFEKAGFRTEINRPFSGVLIPKAFNGRDARLMAIMIEVNRRLYMDEASGERLPSFAGFRLRFHGLLSQFICGLL